MRRSVSFFFLLSFCVILSSILWLLVYKTSLSVNIIINTDYKLIFWLILYVDSQQNGECKVPIVFKTNWLNSKRVNLCQPYGLFVIPRIFFKVVLQKMIKLLDAHMVLVYHHFFSFSKFCIATIALTLI